jgi:hypothetical protein
MSPSVLPSSLTSLSLSLSVSVSLARSFSHISLCLSGSFSTTAYLHQVRSSLGRPRFVRLRPSHKSSSSSQRFGPNPDSVDQPESSATGLSGILPVGDSPGLNVLEPARKTETGISPRPVEPPTTGSRCTNWTQVQLLILLLCLCLFVSSLSLSISSLFSLSLFSLSLSLFLSLTISEQVIAQHKPQRRFGRPQLLSRFVVNYLKDWLYHHREHPYPNDHEKAEMLHVSGLSPTQLNMWFVNARRRYLKPTQSTSNTHVSGLQTFNAIRPMAQPPLVIPMFDSTRSAAEPNTPRKPPGIA